MCTTSAAVINSSECMVALYFGYSSFLLPFTHRNTTIKTLSSWTINRRLNTYELQVIGTILTLSLWRLAAASTIIYCLGWEASTLSYRETHASTAAWLCDCVFTACTYLCWRENPGVIYQKQTLVENTEGKQSDIKTIGLLFNNRRTFLYLRRNKRG